MLQQFYLRSSSSQLSNASRMLSSRLLTPFATQTSSLSSSINASLSLLSSGITSHLSVSCRVFSLYTKRSFPPSKSKSSDPSLPPSLSLFSATMAQSMNGGDGSATPLCHGMIPLFKSSNDKHSQKLATLFTLLLSSVSLVTAFYFFSPLLPTELSNLQWIYSRRSDFGRVRAALSGDKLTAVERAEVEAEASQVLEGKKASDEMSIMQLFKKVLAEIGIKFNNETEAEISRLKDTENITEEEAARLLTEMGVQTNDSKNNPKPIFRGEPTWDEIVSVLKVDPNANAQSTEFVSEEEDNEIFQTLLQQKLQMEEQQQQDSDTRKGIRQETLKPVNLQSFEWPERLTEAAPIIAVNIASWALLYLLKRRANRTIHHINFSPHTSEVQIFTSSFGIMKGSKQYHTHKEYIIPPIAQRGRLLAASVPFQFYDHSAKQMVTLKLQHSPNEALNAINSPLYINVLSTNIQSPKINQETF